ncbi:MAG: hypothetical protein DCF22_24100 [Leptolyngbya sp.]|nr:MAG: hypothetical protein DCF22_24100 [Leptolyngbya sp.]
MKLQIAGFFAASLTLFAAISTGLVCHTTQQLWKPEIAQAAKITTTLLKNKPRLFSRSLRPASVTTQPGVRDLLAPQSMDSSSL